MSDYLCPARTEPKPFVYVGVRMRVCDVCMCTGTYPRLQNKSVERSAVCRNARNPTHHSCQRPCTDYRWYWLLRFEYVLSILTVCVWMCVSNVIEHATRNSRRVSCRGFLCVSNGCAYVNVWACVCVCVCAYVCTCVYLCELEFECVVWKCLRVVWKRWRVSAVQMSVCTRMYMCTYVCVYVRVGVCIHIRISMHVYVYIYIHVCIYIYIYICIYMCICISIHVYMYICIYTYRYIHEYVWMYW